MVLLPYQKNLVKQKARLSITKKSRQIGYSFGFGFKAVYRALFTKKNQLIISASQRQSRIVMSYVTKFIQSFSYLNQFKGLKLELDQAHEKKFIQAYGGASIHSLPPNPDTIRGFNGDIILDEYALYKNSDKVYEAMLPAILRGHNVDISSTCYGIQNMFYKIYTNEIIYKDYERISIDIYEAIKQGLKVDIDLIKNNYDEESFRQEFLAEFIDESTSYFPYSLIRESIYDYGNIEGKCYIGIDIGRINDRTAIIVIREFNGIYYLTRKELLKNTAFDVQLNIIKQIFFEEQPDKVMIDKTGLGMQIAETLEKLYTFCYGVTFTNIYISDIVTFAKKLFETKNIRITDDKDLISEIHAIKKEVTLANNIKFSADRTTKGHSDSAFALFMALHSAKIKKPVTTWKQL